MARLTLSFLGTFEARIDDQPITHYQALLVYLTLNCGRALPRDVLATMFWPDDADNFARKNFRQAIYELRTLLGDTKNSEKPFLSVSRQTVTFNPDGDYRLDVKEFLAAIEAHDLETGTALYHGELLPGFTYNSLQFEDWLRRERESIHQLALEALSALAEEHLQAGRLDKAQSAARLQLKLEPWREIAFRQLMQAYARAGDRVNALAQYELCRAVLADELGLEPSAETTALYRDIEAGRFSAVRTAEPLKPPLRIRHNLPAAPTPLIGRELETDEIIRLLTAEQRRLVSVTGPGGMGKTRLALAAGEHLLPHFADGVYFVDLAPLAGAQEMIRAIAAAIDYQAPDSAQDIQPQLYSALSKRRLLLILDNFEHLLAGSEIVDDILHACPQVSLLVTTRQLLNLAVESRYDLGGLEFPPSLSAAGALAYPALQLFLDCGRRAQPHFSLTSDNAAAVLRICSLVQGMPLGLVLAAAWLGLLEPAEIAAEIEQNLDFLAAELADLPPRQRSMEAVFAGSWQMMAGAEQEVLAKLSIFRGGFTREAAAEVAGANLRILLSLLNKSLIQRQESKNRFTMHELLRQYAAKQRHQAGLNDQTAGNHCRYFARLTAREVQRAAYWLPRHMPQQFAPDRDNLHRAWDFALQQGLAAELADLARGMVIFSFAQGIPPNTMIRQAVQSLQRRGLPDTDRSMILLRQVDMSTFAFTSDLGLLRDQFLAFLPLVEEDGDAELRLWAYDTLHEVHLVLRDLDGALVWVKKAQQTALEMGEEIFIKLMEATELWIRTTFGEQDVQILERLKELLAYFEPEIPDLYVCYVILAALGDQCRATNMYAEALNYFTQAQNIAKRWQDLAWISVVNNNLARAYEQMGLISEAGLVLLDLLDWHLALGQPWQTLGCLTGFGIDFAPFIGGNETAVTILSMIYHHPETSPASLLDLNNGLSRFAEMGEEPFAAAWERGKALDLETAVTLVCAALQAL